MAIHSLGDLSGVNGGGESIMGCSQSFVQGSGMVIAWVGDTGGV